MYKIRNISRALLILLLCLSFSCSNEKTAQRQESGSFVDRVSRDKSDFYHVDLKANKNIAPDLPIGMFDSGTGGLTVLNALLSFDEFDNVTKKQNGGDGLCDFANERFIYLGDQANMPYGSYSQMDKTTFLEELILKDALFLLGNNRYCNAREMKWQSNKQAVKVIVIACNTATAYGKNTIEQMLSRYGNNTQVIGVIDAGISGALSTLDKEEDASVAVIATAGTVSSNGYLNTFLAKKNEKGFTGNIEFFQQPGEGIAGAIDEEISFIDRNSKALRDNYKGPSLHNARLQIKQELLPAYNFDTTANALLFEKSEGKYSDIQLNSPENYIRFHLVSLCEQLKKKQHVAPLKTLILGCTHYPYYSAFFKSVLNELYNLKIEGQYVYRHVLAEEVILIDPALNTAKEVYHYLVDRHLMNKDGSISESEFYISVPDIYNNSVELDSMRNFTYAYKYGREINAPYDTKIVPMKEGALSDNAIARIRKELPKVYEIMELDNSTNQ